MNFNPEFVAIMAHKFSKNDILIIHRALKHHLRKVSKKSDLIEQLSGFFNVYETFYNKLLNMHNPDAPKVVINKTKLSSFTQNELLQIHTLFRQCMRFTRTKQGAITCILAVAKQVQYFLDY